MDIFIIMRKCLTCSIMKKFILNILYYTYIFFFLKTRFSRFVTPGNRKCKKIPSVLRSIGPSVLSSSQLSNFIFFLQDKFSLCKRCRFWWHLDSKILGMPPGGLPREGKPLCAKPMSIFNLEIE